MRNSLFEKGWKRDATRPWKPLGQWSEKVKDAKKSYEDDVDEDDE